MSRARWLIVLGLIALAGGTRVVADEAGSEPAFTEATHGFWAFQSPVDPPLPDVKSVAWPQGALDRFVLAGLEARGLEPAPPTDKRALIRRATFDLHGLPPTTEEVEDFLRDSSSEAFAKVVDRLLSSPRYGERWGRHWLDLARYADSNGMDENMAMASAWRYRDWVVAACIRDQPYDEFVREQLAGDLLPSNDDATRFERLVATGFLVLGAKMLAEDDPLKMEMDIIDEQVDTIGRTIMGLTLGCARCHDHKFDPISSADYYSLAGIFKSTKTMENYRVVAMWSERPLATTAELKQADNCQQRIKEKKREIKSLERAANLPVVLQELRKIALAPAKQLTVPKTLEAYYSAETRASLAALKGELAALEKAQPTIAQAIAVDERPAQNLRIHLRGSHLTLGDEAPRQFPQVLAGKSQPPIPPGAGGRLELARWLTRPDHPLTSRVMVNRIWQGHFGEGLVRSCDNFGMLGEMPDNGPLLDWLARRFVASGWSVKAMHRLMMLSSAYQMSTAYNEHAAAVDPENRLLWRMNRRRLEAEEVRDALLAVAGNLDATMGGTLLTNKNHTYVTSTSSVNDVKYENNRRSVYLPVVRSAVYDVLQAFDFADPSAPNGKRPSTTVAPQALFMMNSALVLRQTRAMADMLLKSTESDDAARVRIAYLRAYSRDPTRDETSRCLRFVDEYRSQLAAQSVADPEARVRAWQALCRVILSSNEFLYVE